MALLTFVGITLLLSLLLYRYIIYPAFFSPLSKIPNAHFSSPILPLWIWSKRRNSTGVRTLLALHQKHGSVVRLAPNEISVNSAEALKTVYVGGFEKQSFYLDAFVNYDTPNLVSMLEHKPHSIQKRMVSNVYSKSYVQNSEDLQKVSENLIFNRLLPIMDKVLERDGELDVLDFLQGVGMDFTSAYLFGLSNGTDFMNDASYRRHWIELYKTFKFQLPKERAGGEIERWCFAMCEAAERFSNSDTTQKEDPSRVQTQPVVFNRLTQSLRDSSAKSADIHSKPTIVIAASEMLDHLIAGHETSGITISYLMYELSRRPHLQTRLRAELLSLNPPILSDSASDVNIPTTTTTTTTSTKSLLPTPHAIDALPFLNALLQETLRLYAAAPAPQPRLTPSSPSSSSPSTSGVTIDGYANIPPNVRVAANPYSIHRNAAVFPEPEAWRPERWLVDDEKEREEMRRWFWVFGSGGRMCLGSNFVLLEMKLVVATLYSAFATEIVNEGDSMEQADAFIAGPVGGRCVLRFRRV